MNLYLVTVFFQMYLVLVQNAPMKKEECKKYLIKYGYMPNTTMEVDTYKNALKDFQTSNNLPVTGKLDDKTIDQMHKPRCGKLDKSSLQFQRNPWGKNKLTYKFRSFPLNGMDRYTAMKEISRAFNVWSKYVPLKFESRPEGRVDIDINFLPAHKGDGVGNTLAFAYYPRVGDIYFDSEPWTVNSYRGTNLFNTAVHEIGHSLGLQHSNHPKAVMSPYISSFNPNFDLHFDDISRIQRLYGRKPNANLINICDINKVDATFYSTSEDALYIIKNNYSWKLKDNKLQADYPKEITDIWPGVPSTIDAAYYYKNNIYFAKDFTVWKFDGETKEYLTLIERIDAGTVVDEKLYLFSGSEFCVFDTSSNNVKLEENYPKLISEQWKGLPATIDSVYVDEKNNFNFFKDSIVYQYDENRILQTSLAIKKWLSC